MPGAACLIEEFAAAVRAIAGERQHINAMGTDPQRNIRRDIAALAIQLHMIYRLTIDGPDVEQIASRIGQMQKRPYRAALCGDAFDNGRSSSPTNHRRDYRREIAAAVGFLRFDAIIPLSRCPRIIDSTGPRDGFQRSELHAIGRTLQQKVRSVGKTLRLPLQIDSLRPGDGTEID